MMGDRVFDNVKHIAIAFGVTPWTYAIATRPYKPRFRVSKPHIGIIEIIAGRQVPKRNNLYLTMGKDMNRKDDDLNEKIDARLWHVALRVGAACVVSVSALLTALYKIGGWAYSNIEAISAAWKAFWTASGGGK